LTSSPKDLSGSEACNERNREAPELHFEYSKNDHFYLSWNYPNRMTMMMTSFDASSFSVSSAFYPFWIYFSSLFSSLMPFQSPSNDPTSN